MHLRKLKFLENYRLSVLLIASIILGGTSQYIYQYKLPLYIISSVMIGFILSSKSKNSIKTLVKVPTFLLIGLFTLFLMYSVPIPPELWSILKGREIILEGYKLLQEPDPWLPVSLHPENTFLSLFNFLPIFAVGLITLLTINEKEIFLAKVSLLLIVVFSAVLGGGQVINQEGFFSLYEISSFKRPIGFFSNTNHFGCLMVMSIPLAYFLLIQAYDKRALLKHNNIVTSLSGITIIFAIASILMSGSSASYLMLFICLPTCMFLFNKHSSITRFSIILFSILLCFLIADFLFFSGEVSSFIHKFEHSGPTSRSNIFTTSVKIREDFGVFGIGPGSFVDVYKIYEDQNALSKIFVNNAHNDYLQLWLELGVFGMIIITGFAIWYFGALIRCISPKKNTEKSFQIYTLISLFPILHSVVDYPLRTIAISSTLTFFIAMMCRNKYTY